MSSRYFRGVQSSHICLSIYKCDRTMISIPYPREIKPRCYKHNTDQYNRRPVHIIHTHLGMVWPKSPETSESSVQSRKDVDRKSVAAERPSRLRYSARAEAFGR